MDLKVKKKKKKDKVWVGAPSHLSGLLAGSSRRRKEQSNLVLFTHGNVLSKLDHVATPSCSAIAT